MRDELATFAASGEPVADEPQLVSGVEQARTRRRRAGVPPHLLVEEEQVLPSEDGSVEEVDHDFSGAASSDSSSESFFEGEGRPRERRRARGGEPQPPRRSERERRGRPDRYQNMASDEEDEEELPSEAEVDRSLFHERILTRTERARLVERTHQARQQRNRRRDEVDGLPAREDQFNFDQGRLLATTRRKLRQHLKSAPPPSLPS